MTIPRATVRLQFNAGFTLDDATELVDYFSALGISHIYASPLQTAQPGSMHGYDIIDPRVVNPEIGGEAALRRLVARLRLADMGLILDIVPNHMGVAGSGNEWWQSVLEWGHESPYFDWFDIDWESEDPLLRNKVLLPILGETLEQVTRASQITLRFDETDGRIFAVYASHRLPLSVLDYPVILQAAESSALAPVIYAFEQVGAIASSAKEQRIQQASVALAMLVNISRSETGMADICKAMRSFSLQDEQRDDCLQRLLERQHYRLTCWRNAAQQLNWRRFFEVSELAGLRVEKPSVFEASHALVFRLYTQGLIDGVRVDHVDGLVDPAGYCRTLRSRLQQLTARRPAFLTTQAPYIVIEKILAYDETVPLEWTVDGTTGYEFMDQVGALMHDPNGAPPLTALWTEWSGVDRTFDEEVGLARRQLLNLNLATEFNALARLLHRIAQANASTSAGNSNKANVYSLTSIMRVLTEILVSFPVYRTYVDANGCNETDRQRRHQAMCGARKTLMPADHALLENVGGWLGGNHPSDANQAVVELCARAVRRFQQITPVLTAKSVEDTAFYRYGRLLSRNEVGSNPARFNISVQEFHRRCIQRLQQFPHNLLATATHDHKRGEDVRARLAVLSEIPDEWADTARNWQRLNRSSGHIAPIGADELMLYQMLVGAWPINLQPDDRVGIEQFCSRIAGWQTKALREAKQRSNWFDPDPDYEATCEKFLVGILADQQFLQAVVIFVKRLSMAGLVNSLSQTLLRMTTPGVPDLYQGTECWDFSLVDPDNRSLVDYAVRRQILASTDATINLNNWEIGAPKLHIIRRTLALRRRAATLFAYGKYVPLSVSGSRATQVVAYLRSYQGSDVLVVAPHLVAALLFDAKLPMINVGDWQDTAIILPPECAGEWTDLFSAKTFITDNAPVSVAALLGVLPVALLWREQVL